MSIITKQSYKNQFSIVLNYWDLNSWTGTQFDAFYSVDLTKILSDPEDFKKSYEMTFNFRSRRGTPPNNGVTFATEFYLAIDLCKGISTQSYTQQYNIVGTIPVSTESTAYTSTTCPSYFDAKPYENLPTVFKDISGITAIRLTLLDAVTNQVFSPFFPDRSRYTCILTFKEL